MPDKDIMQMSILPAYDDNTWIEVVDTNETDPALQNKRMLAKNANRNEHVQGTDQTLDAGGANQVTAASIREFLRRPPAIQYLLANSTSVGEGDIFLTSFTGTSVLYIGKIDNAGISQAAMLNQLASGSFIYAAGDNALVSMQLISAPTDNGSNYSWTVTIRGTYGTFTAADKIILTVIKY